MTATRFSQNGDPIPPGYELLKRIEPQPSGPPQVTQVIVNKKAENGLAGDIVQNATVTTGQFRQPRDCIRTHQGRWQKICRNHHQIFPVRRRQASHGDHFGRRTVLRAGIDEPIQTGNCRISGHFTDQEALGLANVLQNPLRAPLKIVSSEDVDPTLGKDSIRSGILASIYAIIFVSMFMLVYYRVAGLAANVALVINVIILLGVMCSVWHDA